MRQTRHNKFTHLRIRFSYQPSMGSVTRRNVSSTISFVQNMRAMRTNGNWSTRENAMISAATPVIFPSSRPLSDQAANEQPPSGHHQKEFSATIKAKAIAGNTVAKAATIPKRCAFIRFATVSAQQLFTRPVWSVLLKFAEHAHVPQLLDSRSVRRACLSAYVMIIRTECLRSE